jgi:hypothetical protein
MIDFEARLKSLKNRRQGSRERAVIDSIPAGFARNAALDLGTDPRTKEHFETLKESSSIKYAVGAMAPVKRESTEISIREGNRVADNLITGLAKAGEQTTKRLQGSVALDIHIEKHSDVDMLIIATGSIFIETPSISSYPPKSDPRAMLNIIQDIRAKSEDILQKSFYAADVDCSGAKSISLNNGSLARKVDIVPAFWYDSVDYQRSRQEHFRGIEIYNKKEQALIRNYPFKHIQYVHLKDRQYDGNLKRVIRLLKNIIADLPDYKKRVAKRLSSYDLAAIAYHMNERLYTQPYFQLSLVETTRNHLELLCHVAEYREILSVPDGTRKIFDQNNKNEALELLKDECTELAQAIYRDLAPLSTRYDPSVVINKALTS